MCEDTPQNRPLHSVRVEIKNVLLQQPGPGFSLFKTSQKLRHLMALGCPEKPDCSVGTFRAPAPWSTRVLSLT